MSIIQNRKLLALVAAGLAGTVSSVAMGQTVINISGATLLENFVKAPASTNDFIDVDNDGIAGVFNNGPDQLAPFDVTLPFNVNQFWQVQYRAVGSVNGFSELLKFGQTFVTTNDADVNGIRTISATTAYNNGTLYINNGVGVPAGGFNSSNPGGAPVRSVFSSLQATLGTNPATEGIRIDLSPLDVPTFWAVTFAGTPNFSRQPQDGGYGSNANVSRDKFGNTAVNGSATDASQTGGLSSKLATLPPGFNFFNPTNPGAANPSTIFDTQLAYAVIAPVVNYGVGIQQVTISELQHFFMTGRAVTGENYQVVTRDSGSGTRNAWSNCIGLDPSWTAGENIGGLSTLSINNNLGAGWIPSNKGSNGGVEATVQNHRLAVGYAGAERGVTGTGRGSWLITNRSDILAVKNDIYGGTVFARPHISQVLPLTVNSYVIGGPAVLASIGDPRNQNDIGGDLGNTNPRLRNPQAAAYLNNVSRSISAFIALPGSDQTIFSPGELAATQFILFPALQQLHDLVDPIVLVNNSGLNANLNAFTLANNVLKNSAFLSYNASNNGRVPTRQTGTVYSDGVVGGSNYINQGAVAVTYDANLTSRNRISGDFDGNGLRNANDAVEMIKAYRQRNVAGPAWVPAAGTGPIAGAPGTDAVIEILGDFNGDGNFNAADIRYWADGLATNAGTGLLNRFDGFSRVDAAFAGNLFSTTLATGKLYVAGDSAGDIAGAAGSTPGWAPTGSNGVVNATDIDAVYKQFKQNLNVTDGALNWSNLNEAVGGDLSADINGDLVIDQADVCFLVQTILGTNFGDVNLDGVVNAADRTIAVANQGLAGGWAQGDMDGTGTVDARDLAIIDGTFNPCCPADFDGDGFLTGDDFDAFVAAFELGDIVSDFDGDGFVTGEDFDAFVAAFEAGC